MKRNFSLILVAMGMLALISCNQNDNKVAENNKTATDNTNTKTYNGSLPCADCPSIESTLVLNENGTYIMQLLYDTNEGDVYYHENGNWLEENGKLTLTSSSSETTYISLSNDGESVTFLDQEGNNIETDLNYTLTMVKPDKKIGEYTYYADAPIFVESSTNRQYFAPGVDLETAYLATKIEAGTPVYLEVIGYYSLAPSMEEGQFTPVLIQTGTINFQSN